MHSLEAIVARNKAQVQKEYDDAIDRGDLELANRIFEANPDIVPLWLQDPDGDSYYQERGGEA